MRTARLNSCIAAFSSVALAGLATAGCSSSSSPSAGSSASAIGSPSPTGLAAKLLTPQDLPNGWNTDASPPEPPIGNAVCPLLNSTLWSASLANQGEADLSQGLAGPYLVEQLADGTSAQADKSWKAMTDGVGHCTTYTHTGSSGSSTFTIGTTAMPSYGDGSYAFTLNLTISGAVHASGDIVAVRSGKSVLVLYIVGLNGVGKTMVESLVSAAVTKART